VPPGRSKSAAGAAGPARAASQIPVLARRNFLTKIMRSTLYEIAFGANFVKIAEISENCLAPCAKSNQEALGMM